MYKLLLLLEQKQFFGHQNIFFGQFLGTTIPNPLHRPKTWNFLVSSKVTYACGIKALDTQGFRCAGVVAILRYRRKGPLWDSILINSSISNE